MIWRGKRWIPPPQESTYSSISVLQKFFFFPLLVLNRGFKLIACNDFNHNEILNLSNELSLEYILKKAMKML